MSRCAPRASIGVDRFSLNGYVCRSVRCSARAPLYAAADPERDARARRERRDVRASRARADPNTSRGSRRPARRAIRVARGIVVSERRYDSCPPLGTHVADDGAGPPPGGPRGGRAARRARARERFAHRAAYPSPPRGRRTVVPDDADDAPRFPAPRAWEASVGTRATVATRPSRALRSSARTSPARR